jgi:hypothetical protein
MNPIANPLVRGVVPTGFGYGYHEMGLVWKNAATLPEWVM